MLTLTRNIIANFLSKNKGLRYQLNGVQNNLHLVKDGLKYQINLTINNKCIYNSKNKKYNKSVNLNLSEIKRNQLTGLKDFELLHLNDNNSRKHYVINDYIVNDNVLYNKKKRKRVTNNYFKNFISASRVRNYMLEDPFLDYLKMYGFNKIDSNHTIKEDKFTSYIMKKGQDFEEYLVEQIKQKFPNLTFQQICYNLDDIHNIKKYLETVKQMKNGVDIIYQGLLVDNKNLTYGSPDLLIRSDKIKNIFPMIDYNVDGGNKFNSEYHYILCDIKGSTIKMNADDRTMRNEGSMKAFKGQLYIYQKMLNKIQRVENMVSIIWAKNKKNDSKANSYYQNELQHTYGLIDYEGKDSKYIEIVSDAIKWLEELKQKGNGFNLYPKPSHKNLYPNMKNDMSGKYNKIKKHYAEDIKEITLVYNCGVKRRKVAHKKNIVKYNDPKLNSEVLGFKSSSKIGSIVDNILETNRSTNNITPKKIVSSLYNWREAKPLEIFIDFETLNSLVSGITSTRIFMIGICYKYNNKYTEKCFIMKKNTFQGEIEMFDKFYKHMEKLEEELNCQARYYHWYDAEPIFYSKFQYRTKDLDFVDLEKIFRNEPICIKGSLNFKLKSIAKAMYKHNMIKTSWDSNSECEDGRLAMVLANNLYKQYDNFDDIIKTKVMQDIRKYNLVDVKVLYEMLDYLRRNH
tara:strand:- start:1679 stop:3727 length:2049 start_codon:yes stop_codon:yes gene_type:complete